MGEAVRVLEKPQAWSEAYSPEEIREMGYRAIDRWVEQVTPVLTGSSPPDLLRISKEFMRTRNELTASLLKALIGQMYREEIERLYAPCPDCGKMLARKRVDRKRISTMLGELEIARAYFHCARCRRGFHPLDRTLGLATGAHQYDVQEKVTCLAADLPYATAAEHFERLTGVSATEHFQHDTLNAIGAEATLEAVIPQAAEIEARITEAEQTGSRWRPVLVVSADGAMAPIRPPGKRKEKRGAGSWQEVKGVRIYLIGGDARIIELVSWHRRAESCELKKDLRWIADRIPKDRVRIALVGDGADWVWDILTAAFPKARQVLDYYHCSQHIHAVARAQFGETVAGWQWAEAQLTCLYLGEVQRVIEGLQELRAEGSPADDDIRKLIRYLIDHEERVDYGAAKRSGSPRGSGAMESANKFICQVRLKRPGAWWLAQNSEAMLRIRCAIFNGTFDRVFARYMERQALKRRAPRSAVPNSES
jgi:hypothetical protein